MVQWQYLRHNNIHDQRGAAIFQLGVSNTTDHVTCYRFEFENSMAGEEGDPELRDLVAQTLETQGVLGKIRVC